MHRLDVTIEEPPGAIVVRLQGHSGVREAETLRQHLSRLLEHRPALVILDLSRLDFIGVLPMQVLSCFRRLLLRQDGRVVLAGASPALRQLLAIGGLDCMFPKVRDVETALTRARRSRLRLACPESDRGAHPHS